MPTPPDSRHPDGQPDAAQPKWRRDFPIDVEQDEYVSRRDFAKFLVLTSGAMALGQVVLVAESVARRDAPPPARRAIARLDELPPGGVLRFDYPERGDACLLARLDDGELVAYDQKCTHLSCAVTPDLASGRLLCPCHKGFFDVSDGRPLAGPPRRPLARITLEVTDGVIHATGVELRT